MKLGTADTKLKINCLEGKTTAKWKLLPGKSSYSVGGKLFVRS